jgi:hypothetical protein
LNFGESPPRGTWGKSRKNPVGSKEKGANIHNRVRFALRKTSSIHIPGKEVYWPEPTRIC